MDSEDQVIHHFIRMKRILNGEMSGNFTAVREMSGISAKIREMLEKKSCQGKLPKRFF